MDKKILFIVTVPRQAKAKKFWNSLEFKEKFDVINQYDLEDVDLLKYKAILISMHIDQYLLELMKDRLEKFLSEGRKILFNGHIVKEFLNNLKTFIPMNHPSLDDFKVKQINPHPLFDGFKIEKLNLRKGVAGFFGRGGNPVPQGAKIILSFKNGEVPCDWEYTTPNGGILYVHSGNDLWMCFEEQSSGVDEMFANIVEWLED